MQLKIYENESSSSVICLEKKDVLAFDPFAISEVFSF